MTPAELSAPADHDFAEPFVTDMLAWSTQPELRECRLCGHPRRDRFGDRTRDHRDAR